MSPPRMTEAEAAAIPGLREALRKTRLPWIRGRSTAWP